MKQKIKDLTEKELKNICNKYKSDCHDCPLVIINGCEMICIKDGVLNKEIKINLDERELGKMIKILKQGKIGKSKIFIYTTTCESVVVYLFEFQADDCE